MTERERLHALVDGLADPEIHAALRFVEFLRSAQDDPVARALLLAPEDDEPFTEEDRQALREAEQDFAAGDFLTQEEARRELLSEA